VSYFVVSRWGSSVREPTLDVLKEILAELDVDDLEHACAYLSHESGWSLMAYQTGAVEWVNVEEDDPEERHMDDVSREKALKLWLKLSRGDVEAVEAEPWLPGRTELPSPSREEIERWQHELDRKFYDSLGAEHRQRSCRAAGCTRGAVEMSVFCRVHHFENMTRRPCPFDD
jgi:hypothetical protein